MGTKKILGLVLGLLLIGKIAFAGNWWHGDSDEPTGFRNIPWGTDINTLSDMELLDTDENCGGIREYKKKGDNLQIGAAKIDKISYSFWEGKFCSVSLLTKGEVNFACLREAVFLKYGPGLLAADPQGVDSDRRIWWGSISWMCMEYSEITKQGGLYMMSKKYIPKRKR